jgi:hypothetical protein
VTLFVFLSLKNDVNVPSKSNRQKKEAWIRGSVSGSGSTSKCHGFATLVLDVDF